MPLVLPVYTVVFFLFFLSLRSRIPCLTALVTIPTHSTMISGEHTTSCAHRCTTDRILRPRAKWVLFYWLLTQNFRFLCSVTLTYRKSSLYIHPMEKFPHTTEALNTLNLNSFCRTGNLFHNRCNFNATKKICLFPFQSASRIHPHSCPIKLCLGNSN